MKGIYQSRLEAYFPTALIYMGYLLMVISLPVIAIHYLLTPILILAGLFLVTAHYGIVINAAQKRYKAYWGVLGFKSGRWRVLPEIHHLFISKKNYSQVYGSRGTSSQIRFTIYRGFVKTLDDENIEVSQSKNKSKVLAGTKELADQLQVQLLDGTTGT